MRDKSRGEIERVRQAVASCDSSPSAPVVIFVSKMIPVKKRDITDSDGKPWRPPTGHGGSAASGGLGFHDAAGGGMGAGRGGDADDQDPDSLAFVAFARVLSGTVTPSTPLLVSFSDVDCVLVSEGWGV